MLRRGRKGKEERPSWEQDDVEVALGRLQAEGYGRKEAVERLLQIGAKVLLLACPEKQTVAPPVPPLFPSGH